MLHCLLKDNEIYILKNKVAIGIQPGKHLKYLGDKTDTQLEVSDTQLEVSDTPKEFCCQGSPYQVPG